MPYSRYKRMIRATISRADAETAYSACTEPNPEATAAAMPVKREALSVCQRQALPLAEAVCVRGKLLSTPNVPAAKRTFEARCAIKIIPSAHAIHPDNNGSIP